MTVEAIATSDTLPFHSKTGGGLKGKKRQRAGRARVREDELPTPPERAYDDAEGGAEEEEEQERCMQTPTAMLVDGTAPAEGDHARDDMEEEQQQEHPSHARREVEEEVAQVLSDMQASAPATFFSRVSSLPVVTSTMRTIGEVYEHGKASSRVIRYSADTVESLLSNTRPMLTRVNNALEPQIGQLDQFACRQLDRWSMSWNVDSLRSLKYCVEWLQFATRHIDHQISLLKDALNSLVVNLQNNSALNAQRLLQGVLDVSRSVKKEVAETLRKVVDVIGCYASVGLPSDAKNRIRGFILELPSRWANINQHDPQINGHQAEAERVLTLAEESNRMLQGIQSVLGQTVDAAESWIGRFSWSRSSGSSKEDPMEE